MTDQTALPPLLAAARALELDRDAASSGESHDYRRGMTRAVHLLRMLNEEESPALDRAAIRAATFREAADALEAQTCTCGCRRGAELLRHMADEARP